MNHVTRADLLHRLTAALVVGFFLTLARVPPAVGVFGLLLPWAGGGPAPHPVLLGSLAYTVAFVGWLTSEGVAAVGGVGAGGRTAAGGLFPGIPLGLLPLGR